MKESVFFHITKKDLTEGQEIMNVLNILDDESLKMAMVYIGALRDRQMVDEIKKETA